MAQSLFENIPCIYAGDLPFEVSGELLDWNEEVPLHESTGVLYFDYGAIESVPLFRAWMVEIGAWPADVTDDGGLRVAMVGT